jgi:hypothetical protein
MMYNCARLPEDDFQRAARRDPLRVSRGRDFPVRTRRSRASRPPRRPAVSSRQSASRSATSGSRAARREWRERRSRTSRGQTPKAIKDCVDDQSAYLEEWADRAADDKYGYKDMLDDMAKASVRMVFDGARILNLAVKNAEVGAAAARAERANQSPSAAARGTTREQRFMTHPDTRMHRRRRELPVAGDLSVNEMGRAGLQHRRRNRQQGI